MARGICGVARRGFCGVTRLGFAVWPGWGFALLRYCVIAWPGWLAVFLRKFAVARLAGWGFAVARLFFGTKICACEFTRKTKKGQINNKAQYAPTTRRLPLAPMHHYIRLPLAPTTHRGTTSRPCATQGPWRCKHASAGRDRSE